MHSPQAETARRGFTLVESCIVMTIMVLLSSILMIKYGLALDAARSAKAKQELQVIANDIGAYLASRGTLPRSSRTWGTEGAWIPGAIRTCT